MTNRQLRKLRAEIVRELSNLSHNGWRDAKPYDYLPLEQELGEIDAVLRMRGEQP